MNAYQFIVKMKDYASSGLRDIAKSAGVADSKVDELNRSGGRMNKTFSKMKGLMAGVFTIAALTLFTNKVISARAEYEKFEAVLTNTYQSADVGRGALNMLTDFAAKTPFQLNELTGAFVKLANRGFNPTRKELTSLGDLAASQGKGFDQLTEAILDAQTGEFERLKEFGIKGSKAGDKVSLSFKGVTTTVNNNEEALRGVLLQYGNLTGVAGSMEAISKTLGGRISNLKDQWNSFLVAVGGESGSIFAGAINLLSIGLGFLTDHLPEISQWFKILWSFIEPVGIALWNFVKAAFGFSGAGNVLETFGAIMMGVLNVVGWFTTGLTTVLDLLTPFADVIALATGVWAAFNLVMAISPIGWIVIGIVALITVIGIVTKYTSGWGNIWQTTSEGMKKSLMAFVFFSKANFDGLVNSIMIGLDMIKRGWYRFREVVGMGESSQNMAMIKQLSNDIEKRKDLIAKGYADAAKAGKEAAEAFGITIDTEGIKKDFQGLKDKFSKLGQTGAGTSAYDNYLASKANDGKGSGDGKSKTGTDTIVSGGSRQTHITVTIGKLQDDTKIYVNSTEQGVSQLGEKVQEMLLRAINSVNQLQTG